MADFLELDVDNVIKKLLSGKVSLLDGFSNLLTLSFTVFLFSCCNSED